MESQNRKVIRWALIILGVVITCAGIFFMATEFRDTGTVEQEIPVAAYTSETGVNYSVLPKANMIYSDDVLEEGLTYITEFVNQVNTDFEYKVIGDSSMKVNGNYQVNVQFSGYTDAEDGKATVWSKVKTLVPKTDFLLNATGDVLSQKVRINLGDYIGFANTVIEASNIKVPVSATITMSGEAVVDNAEGESMEPILGSIVIPLDKSYFNIEKQVPEVKEGSIKITEEVRAPLNMTNMIIRGFAVLIGIGIILMGILLKPLTEEEQRAKLIKKILSSYGSRSVGVSEIPTDGINDTYDIKLIEDIVKVADELGKPILYEYKDNIADIDFFCVVDGKSIYKYMLQTI